MTLEQALENWRTQHFHQDRSKAAGEYLTHEGQLDLAEYIANWQKEQMQKDVIPAKVRPMNINQKDHGFISSEVFDLEKYGLAFWDNVRIVILPKEH